MSDRETAKFNKSIAEQIIQIYLFYLKSILMIAIMSLKYSLANIKNDSDSIFLFSPLRKSDVG